MVNIVPVYYLFLGNQERKSILCLQVLLILLLQGSCLKIACKIRGLLIAFIWEGSFPQTLPSSYSMESLISPSSICTINNHLPKCENSLYHENVMLPMFYSDLLKRSLVYLFLSINSPLFYFPIPHLNLTPLILFCFKTLYHFIFPLHWKQTSWPLANFLTSIGIQNWAQLSEDWH